MPPTIGTLPCYNNMNGKRDTLVPLPNNPRNQSHCHIPFSVDFRNNKADFIPSSRLAAVIAAVGDCIDADMEPDKNSSFMDVRHNSSIFPLHFTLGQICHGCIGQGTFNVSR